MAGGAIVVILHTPDNDLSVPRDHGAFFFPFRRRGPVHLPLRNSRRGRRGPLAGFCEGQRYCGFINGGSWQKRLRWPPFIVTLGIVADRSGERTYLSISKNETSGHPRTIEAEAPLLQLFGAKFTRGPESGCSPSGHLS